MILHPLPLCCVFPLNWPPSVYTWNIVDLSNVRRLSAHFYHSRGVWCVDCMSLNPTSRFVKHGDAHTRATDPTIPLWWSDSTFVTCADDGTIRFWDLTEQLNAHNEDPMAGFLDDSEVVRAANSQTKEELVRIIFTDSTHKFLCIGDRPCVGVGSVGSPSPLFSTSGPNDSAVPSPSSPTIPSLGESILPGSNSSTTNGCCVRTVCISPDYRHLAAGDRDGNLRVYALASLEQVFQITAHDSEILSLNFFRSDSVPELMLLCSASRDRLIHIFDPNQGYSLVQTVADHSAAIFAAHIVETEEDGEIRLISCGMDKSLLIRVLEPDETGLTARFSLEHHLVGRHSQLDAAFTPSIYPSNAEGKSSQRKRYLAVACQDRRLRIYNVTTGRQVRCYRGSFNEDGCLVRCAVDPTGSIVATSGSDKQMNVFHLLSGESIATLFGHSELALGLRFLPSLRHLITVSSDSCIFVWRLASGLTQQLNDRYFGNRRSSSCSGLPTTVVSSGLRSVASFRLPRSYRTTEEERSGGEDECVSFQPSSNWTDSPTDCDRTDDCDEDSESDLVKLETTESLPRDDFCHPNATDDLAVKSDTSNAHFAGFDVHSDHSLSHSSHPSENTTVQSDQKRLSTSKPTFYFSVSALPAWARRKVSRLCVNSLYLNIRFIRRITTLLSILASNQMERLSSDCDSQPNKQSDLAASAPGARSNLPKSDLLTKQRILLDEDFEGSNDSLNLIPKTVDVSPPSDKRRTDVMFRSAYHCTSESGSSHTRVADSRNLRARASRSTVSRDPSPKSVAISAPTTPFRRERSSADYENNRLAMRQPKRQPPTSGANYTQSISAASRSGTAGVGFDEDSLTISRKTNWLRSSMSRVADERARTSVCEGDSHCSTNLRKPSSMRSTVHSKSSVELSSNRASCAPTKNATQSADSCTFLAMLDRDKVRSRSSPLLKMIFIITILARPSGLPHGDNSLYFHVCVPLQFRCSSLNNRLIQNCLLFLQPTVNSPHQDNLLVSRASLPLARFSIQTLEEIEERPLSQPSIFRGQSVDFSAGIGTLNSSSLNVATDPSSAHTLPMTSVADSASDVSVICTKPTYTAPTYASRQKTTHSNLQDLGTMTVHPKIPSFTPSPSRKLVPAPTCSSKPNHISISTDEVLTRPTGKIAPFSDVSVKNTDALLPDALHPEHDGDETSLPQSDLVSPQLTRARWLPTPSSSVTYDSTSSMVPVNTILPQKSRPTRPNDLLIARCPAHLTEQKFVTTLPSNISSRPDLVSTTNSYQVIKNDPYKYSTLYSMDGEQADSSSHSKLVELDRFHSTRESLEAVQHALEIAVKRCAALRAHHSDLAADVRVNALRSVVTEELERRFAQLRAMLGLEPMCVAAPVARVLLADMIERLIPELRLSARSDRMGGHDNLTVLNTVADRGMPIRSSPTGSTFDWVVDSTTESSPSHAQPNASKNSSKVEEEQV
ncbi:mitogen-activated protein kinase binding protein 1 [Paragonimus westermani]|uniref:Mitogen-activated protein kinase binding protein 1 n=1 Tax=Paragonimus westermani TaxID=34504 RepID=A0A5J4NK95_9TREM|nr:mitogen-activated protein kinase binding protein 1 [Paragonimus westermani]